MEVSLGIYALFFIFLFLVLPGFIARRLYYNGEFSKQYNWNNGSLYSLVSSLFIGTTLTLLFISLLNLLRRENINIDDILNSFDDLFVKQTEIKNSKRFEGISSLLYNKYLPYIVLFYLFSAFLGFVCNKIVLLFKLDTKFKFFRFQNNWHYLFTGKILRLKTHDIQENSTRIKYVYLDVLVAEKDNETTLYSGLYADYELSHKDINKLEKIHLFKASRYKKTENGTACKEIPGNIFSILGERILNINSTYIYEPQSEKKHKIFTLKKNTIEVIELIFIIVFLFILVANIFSINIFKTSCFENIIKQNVGFKVFFLLGLNIFISLLTPFQVDKQNEKITFNSAYIISLQVVILVLFSVLAYHFYQ